ncbi:MAG: pantetheine-phosphate adenylyltransferase [Clostridiales bacterium]|jgi:pantetheine-phosphate adenylyltransferase|nr:pantetheine-phosphate adenylyltransferase [Clostridiales bacterium]
MITAIFPGSFDPMTLGHMDLIERLAKMSIADKLIVAIGDNPAKDTLFTLEERICQIKLMTKEFDFIEVDHYRGLVADYAKRRRAAFIVRGIRNSSDLEYEMELSHYNNLLNPEIETLFIPARLAYSRISSRAIKEIARNGGNIHSMTSAFIQYQIKEKYSIIKSRNSIDSGDIVKSGDCEEEEENLTEI